MNEYVVTWWYPVSGHILIQHLMATSPRCKIQGHVYISPFPTKYLVAYSFTNSQSCTFIELRNWFIKAILPQNYKVITSFLSVEEYPNFEWVDRMLENRDEEDEVEGFEGFENWSWAAGSNCDGRDIWLLAGTYQPMGNTALKKLPTNT